MTPKQVLLAVRERLSDPNRWLKGRLFDDDGVGACVRGAFELSSPMTWETITVSLAGRPVSCSWPTFAGERGRAEAYFVQAIGVESTTGDIERWNDHPERTHADVMAACDVAIALAEADEILADAVRPSEDASETDAGDDRVPVGALAHA